ncbi:type II secretion system protein GspL [Desulfopila aestuarii]|uniref:Type II secretion system protein L n=1 Tax=Desulfopila aestuarii DSM 18488 TaxID=1121416 RepID=A0A1M7YE21_9BACT|nr:type II secretion system protein GspL [Desulfopila aestuarii]SHO50894.1 type II secretion system protein L [Desulfopila aestuarii DSM 18488]
MENLLALDISDNCVCGVLLEFGQKVTLVRGYGFAVTQDSTIAEAVADVVRQTDFQKGECRLSISAGKCFFRNLSLPFRDMRKVAKVLPFELEDLTSFSMDELQLDSLATAGLGEETEIVSAMVEKGYLAETLAQVLSAGIDPDWITVGSVSTAAALPELSTTNRNCMLLDIGLKQATLVLIDEGRVVLIRTLGVDAETMGEFSLSSPEGNVICGKPENITDIVERILQPIRQTLLSVGRSHYLEDGAVCFVNGAVGLYPALFEQLRRKLPFEVNPCNISKRLLLKIEHLEGREWNRALLNTPLALALWKKKDAPIFNFRAGEFRKRRSFKELKKNALVIGCGAVAVCCAIAGYLGWDYSQLARQRDALNDEIVTVFRQTLPEVSRVVNPVQQLRVKVDESQKVYGASQSSGSPTKLALLAELSSRIPESLTVRITRLVSDQNDLRIMAETANFNTVDNVKRELEKSELFRSVVISSANLAPRGGGVRFELRVQFQ